jgi:methylated-DNA-[protein]-cysteine S-methyltransferase
LASGWTTEADALLPLVHPSLRDGVAGGDVLRRAAAAVRAYYDGNLWAPGTVSVRQVSGPYRMRAWVTLRCVGPGERATYADLARLSGHPAAVRAAGSACGYNAAALFVPCHRIVRSDGGLGGFRWGLAVKQSLLRRETRVPLPIPR